MRLFTILLLLIMTIPACKSKGKMVQEKSGSQLVVVAKKVIDGDKAVLTGIMRDAATNEPIVMGAVILQREGISPIGVMTNEEGQFEMKNVPPGKYQLVAELMDFERLTVPFKLEAGYQYTVEIIMNEQQIMLEKPVIYLYPPHTQEVHVELDYDGSITHSYPAYPENGWQVIAEPDGTLRDERGMEYYALFWEGVPREPLTFSDGFVVPGKETARFLEEQLAFLGLNRREANEFIMHWLPRMEDNPYNLIHFSGSDYEAIAQLRISPEPETVIRVMMLTQPLNANIDFPLQDLTPLKKVRKGFTIVEWGGAVVEMADTAAGTLRKYPKK
jgi:hypothetical protein